MTNMGGKRTEVKRMINDMDDYFALFVSEFNDTDTVYVKNALFDMSREKGVDFASQLEVYPSAYDMDHQEIPGHSTLLIKAEVFREDGIVDYCYDESFFEQFDLEEFFGRVESQREMSEAFASVISYN